MAEKKGESYSILNKKIIKYRTKSEIILNLKKNWAFPFSAAFFFCLPSSSIGVGYFLSVVISFILLTVIASQCNSFVEYLRKETIVNKIIYIFITTGICLGTSDSFLSAINKTSQINSLKESIPHFMTIVISFSSFCAIMGFFFVYTCVTFFCKKMKGLFKKIDLFSDMKKGEIIIYIILFLLTISYMAIVFVKTDAFYGTSYSYDVIYTSDSPSFIDRNVYLSLTHPENDLRQPLFALFSAPFIGIPYLIGRIFFLPLSIRVILINSVQIMLLFVATLMVSKMIKMNAIDRICFMIFSCCSYTYLLFELMIEQYIFAFFYLILGMYLICENKKSDKIIMTAIGGTLLTGLAIVPFSTQHSLIKEPKKAIKNIIETAVIFLLIMLVFCRFDIIYNLAGEISWVDNFTSATLTVKEKILQYITFVRNCFIFPEAKAMVATGRDVWRQMSVVEIDIIGIAIFIISSTSAFLNKENKFLCLSAYWIVFSVVVLVILGWGTQENGLILYSLYFGWAFIALLAGLVEKIQREINIPGLSAAIMVLSGMAMLYVNIPAIIEMVEFGIKNFPL